MPRDHFFSRTCPIAFLLSRSDVVAQLFELFLGLSMRRPRGFQIIRGIGRRDLSLDTTGDSSISYIARTNYLKATRSADAATYVDAHIARPIGTIDIAARPDQTIATMNLTDPYIKMEVTARTKSAPSVTIHHSFDKSFRSFSALSEISVQSNPFRTTMAVTASQRLGNFHCFGRLALRSIRPTLDFFVDHEFAQGWLRFSPNSKLSLSLGDPSSFFCCSATRMKPFKVGGFARADRYSLGAIATARKALTIIAVYNHQKFSLAGLYDRTLLNQKFVFGFRTQIHGIELGVKFETPDRLTALVTVRVPDIHVTLVEIGKVGGKDLFETVRYGIDASFLRDD
jgi:hypothetical protein